MRRMTALTAGAVACGTALALAVPTAAGATAQRDRISDRAFVQCSKGSMLQVDLEREGRKFEVDVEVYAAPRERWTVTIGTPGRVTHTFTRTTNREGELNGWRYMPRSSGTIEVRATAADGERCRARVRG
jgi:hypothetical protein